MHETDFDLAPECDPDEHAFWLARVEAAYGVAPLAGFAAGGLGATRFVWCGEDSPDFVLSCGWRSRGVWVELVEGFAFGWEGDVRRRRLAYLPTGLLPRMLRNWARVRRAFAAAPSFAGELQIGGAFYHALFCDGGGEVVGWAGEGAGEARPRRELIAAYQRVWWAARVRGWFPGGVTSRPASDGGTPPSCRPGPPPPARRR